jgi:sugar-specific transcriptional regulator TrmB
LGNLLLSGNVRKVLQEAGLTGSEIQAYATLLEWGGLTAKEISHYANLPFSKIYRILDSLQKRGWIETVKARPAKYYPKSPVEALSAVKLEITEKMKNWEQIIRRELQPLFEKKNLQEKPDIWILRGEQAILDKIEEVIGKAKIELMVAVPSFAKRLVKKTYPFLRSMERTRVKILIMIAGESGELKNAEALSFIGAEIRLRKQMFGGGIIVDGKEALLLLGEEKPSLVIWSNHKGLVSFARDYFQYLWKSSQKLT